MLHRSFHRKNSDSPAVEEDTAGASFPVPELDPSTALATRKVQKAWRNSFQFRKTADYAKKLSVELDINSNNAKALRFEALAQLLRQENVVTAARSFVQRIHLLCVFRHGTVTAANIGKDVNVRVVLAAFMIVHHPTHVFEIRHTLENELIAAAIDMLSNFEQIVAAVLHPDAKHSQSLPMELTANFQAVLYTYLAKFKAWKVPDEKKLFSRIRHALIALYKAQKILPPAEPVDSQLRAEFQTQIQRLRSKMVMVSGQAALDKFDDERTRWCDSGDDTSGGNDDDAGDGRMPANRITHELLLGRLSNHQIAHELLINPLFQLTEHGSIDNENVLFQRVREEFQSSFWDSIVDDIRLSPPCYARVLRVLDEIRNGISDLSDPGYELARDVLDTAHIQARVEAGAFEWDDSKKLVQDTFAIIVSIQTPNRDEESKTLFKEFADALDAAATPQEKAVSFAKGLEFLLKRINICRVDAANARLRLISPVVQDHGIEYEGGKFQRKLDNGEISLDNTKKWINAALKSTIDIASKIQDGVTGSIVDAHTTAITLLVDGSIIPDALEANLPETLMFDGARIAKMRRDFRDIIKANIVLTIVTTEIKDEKELEKVYSCFDGLDDNDELDPTVFAASDALKAKFDSVIHENSEVYKLLRARLANELRANALADTPRAISISPMQKIPATLAKRASRLVDTFRAVSRINRLAHKKIYEQIVPEIAIEVCTAGI
jgi:hypothetical protein